jgi:hypothetical protein
MFTAKKHNLAEKTLFTHNTTDEDMAVDKKFHHTGMMWNYQ